LGYIEAKKKLDQRRKKEGVYGLNALFPNKQKAAILKSINEEEKKIEAEYRETTAKAKATYMEEITTLEAKVKTQADKSKNEKANAKKEYEQTIAQINSTRKQAEAERKKEIGVEYKKAEAEAKRDLAEAKTAKKQKLVDLQKETIADSKVIAGEKADIEKEYKSGLTKAESKYTEAKKKLDQQRKKEGVYGFKALFLSKEKAAALKSINEEKNKINTDYREAKVKAEAGQRKAISNLQEKSGSLAIKRAEEKAQIKSEYKEAVAKIDLKLQYTKEKAKYAQINLPEDTTPRFLVKELRISGNTIISTAEMLKKLPMIYKVSEGKDETSVEQIYDFRILHELILNPGQEREVSMKTIHGLTQYVLSVYQENGYAGIYVYVPAKAVKGAAELEGKILPIQILEAKVADVNIRSYDFRRQEQVEKGVLKSSLVESWSPVKEGQVIRKKELDDLVRLLNLNPDRHVSAVISKGTEPNSLNLTYDIYEANPWHWYVQLDNAGTAQRQWSPRYGFINTNLTGMDDSLSFMFQSQVDTFQDNYALLGNYEFPILSPRLRLGVFAGYSEFDITPETGGDISFRGDGAFHGYTLSYNVLQIDDWFFDLHGSLSHEKSKYKPSLGLKTDIDMDLLGLGFEIHRSDSISDTSISFNKTESFDASSKERFTTARVDSDPDFAIYTLSAAHRQFLDKNKIHELNGSFRRITSNERLVPAKMTTFGGLYTVRGYEEDEVVADGGIFFSAQYKFDLTKYMEKDLLGHVQQQPDSQKSKQAWSPNISLLTFVDHGRAQIRHPIPGEKRAQELWSAGLGTIVELGNNAQAAIYYGVPLRGTDRTDRGEGTFNFNFIYRF